MSSYQHYRKEARMSNDELAFALFSVDQRLDTLVDDEDSPLWDERQELLAEAARRGLSLR